METKEIWQELFNKICRDAEKATREFLKELEKPQYLKEIQAFICQNQDRFSDLAPQIKITCFFVSAKLATFFKKKGDRRFQEYFTQIHPWYTILVRENLLKDANKSSLALVVGDMYTTIGFFNQAENYYRDAVEFCSSQNDSEMLSYYYMKQSIFLYTYGLNQQKEPAPQVAKQKYDRAIEAIENAIKQPKPYGINQLYLFHVTVLVQRSSLLCGQFYSQYKEAAFGLLPAIDSCLKGLATDMNMPEQRASFLNHLKNCFESFSNLASAKLIDFNKEFIETKIAEIRNSLRPICQPNEPALISLDEKMNSLLVAIEAKSAEHTCSPIPSFKRVI